MAIYPRKSILAEVDIRIDDHAANASAHHTKTTRASEITSEEFDDARIAANIARDLEVDGKIADHAAATITWEKLYDTVFELVNVANVTDYLLATLPNLSKNKIYKLYVGGIISDHATPWVNEFIKLIINDITSGYMNSYVPAGYTDGEGVLVAATYGSQGCTVLSEAEISFDDGKNFGARVSSSNHVVFDTDNKQVWNNIGYLRNPGAIGNTVTAKLYVRGMGAGESFNAEGLRVVLMGMGS